MLDQKGLFEYLKAEKGQSQNLVHNISEVLGLSISNTYKKISGDSQLTADQLLILVQKMNIPLASLLSNDLGLQPYPFESDALIFKPYRYDQYWQNILDHLNQVRNLTNLRATVLANEIPFSYMLQFPRLIGFKMDIWNRLSWDIKDQILWDGIDSGIGDNALNPIFKNICDFYFEFPTEEIWNSEMLRLTYMQIRYYVASGYLTDQKELNYLLEEIDQLITYLKDIAESGQKFFRKSDAPLSEIKIYLNQLNINSEVIFIQGDEYQLVYNKYDTPNYLRSADRRICEHMEWYLGNLKRHSSLISIHGAQQRNSFFRQMFEAHDRFRDRMNGLIEFMNG